MSASHNSSTSGNSWGRGATTTISLECPEVVGQQKRQHTLDKNKTYASCKE